MTEVIAFVLGFLLAVIWRGMIVTRKTYELMERISRRTDEIVEISEEAEAKMLAARRMSGLGPEAKVVQMKVIE